MKLPMRQIMSATGGSKQFQAVRGTIWASLIFTGFIYGSCMVGTLVPGACKAADGGRPCVTEKQAFDFAAVACLAGILGLNTKNPNLKGRIDEFLEIDDDLIAEPIRKIEQEITGFREEIANTGFAVSETVEKTIDETKQEIVGMIPALGSDVIGALTDDQQLEIYRKVWRERHHFD
jgi:hypothetical protein